MVTYLISNSINIRWIRYIESAFISCVLRKVNKRNKNSNLNSSWNMTSVKFRYFIKQICLALGLVLKVKTEDIHDHWSRHYKADNQIQNIYRWNTESRNYCCLPARCVYDKSNIKVPLIRHSKIPIQRYWIIIKKTEV